MPEYVRVKQAKTGHHLSVPVSHFKAAPAGAYQVLNQPAASPDGRPLPPKYRTSVSRETAKKKSTTPIGQSADTQKEKS